jgi:hypothetical protein
LDKIKSKKKKKIGQIKQTLKLHMEKNTQTLLNPNVIITYTAPSNDYLTTIQELKDKLMKSNLELEKTKGLYQGFVEGKYTELFTQFTESTKHLNMTILDENKKLKQKVETYEKEIKKLNEMKTKILDLSNEINKL